jgi:hypothetical protein
MVAILLVVFFSQIRWEFVEKRRLKKDAIVAILDALRDEYFTTVPENEKFNHRVTLLVARRLATRFFKKYLVVYARAGTHERSKTILRIHDEERFCEGIAGRIWYTNGVVTKSLPNWPTDPGDAVGRKAFADAGYMEIGKVCRLHVIAVALSGTIVRVGGKKWGVLLLDSTTQDAISTRKEKSIRRYGTLLGNAV